MRLNAGRRDGKGPGQEKPRRATPPARRKPPSGFSHAGRVPTPAHNTAPGRKGRPSPGAYL